MASKNLTPVQAIADSLGAETPDGIICGKEIIAQLTKAAPEQLAPYYNHIAVLQRECARICKEMPMRRHTYLANRDICIRELAEQMVKAFLTP